jgi:hypothetical protein
VPVMAIRYGSKAVTSKLGVGGFESSRRAKIQDQFVGASYAPRFCLITAIAGLPIACLAVAEVRLKHQ